jgi:hypothetical protein
LKALLRIGADVYRVEVGAEGLKKVVARRLSLASRVLRIVEDGTELGSRTLAGAAF